MRPAVLAFAVASALITGWTIRRLWRRATDRYTQLVYTFGVKGFGGTMFAATILDYVAQGASLRRLIIQLLVGIPISLWSGYLFGRLMAWTLRVRPDGRAV